MLHVKCVTRTGVRLYSMFAQLHFTAQKNIKKSFIYHSYLGMPQFYGQEIRDCTFLLNIFSVLRDLLKKLKVFFSFLKLRDWQLKGIVTHSENVKRFTVKS